MCNCSIMARFVMARSGKYNIAFQVQYINGQHIERKEITPLFKFM